MKRFGLLGAAGYVAPRHLKAIKQTNNDLICAFDPHDSVGILDNYFPKAEFFTDYKLFERFIEDQQSAQRLKPDYLSVCSPNSLHDSHIKLGILNGMDVICEKPIVLTPEKLDEVENLEKKTGNKIFTVMQLRYHPVLMEFRNKLLNSEMKSENSTNVDKVTLKYVTPRGRWYHTSWKGDVDKSGGIATNIGIHLFDLLIWLYGNVCEYEITLSQNDKCAGRLYLKNAHVEWFLSIDANDLPEEAIQNNKHSYRSLISNGEEIEFSDGFTDLHTKVYEEILHGRGMGIQDARPSIELVSKLRNHH